MAVLGLKDVCLSFGGPPLLDHVNLQVEPGQRVCLLGRNGAGKSTLMKLVCGEAEPNRGDVSIQQGARVAHLDQEVPAGVHGTVADVVASGLPRREDPLRASKAISLLKLDPGASFDALSSGYRRRVMLAKALAGDPDLLLLDEPTNHMDIDAICALESFLSRYQGAVLFITHDRAFLRRLATRIIELDRGQLADWRCDYDTFLYRKQAHLEAQEEEWARQDKKLAQEEAWIRKGIRARRRRNEGRVRQLMDMRAQRRQRRERTGVVNMQAQEAERTGQLVVQAQGVHFGYPGRELIRDFSATIQRRDKVGVIGPNGVGKTSLVQILLGRLPPQAGKVRHGANVQAAYFDQLREQLDEDKSVYDNVAHGHDTVFINGKPRHVTAYLGDFLFPADRARSLVRQLSGGERNRLLLARLFTRPSNLLVMDEPTNDLDAETLELLEELLLDYEGTLLLVSHDRALLNNVATSTLVFEEEGRVKEYVGGYDDWLRQRQVPDGAAGRPKPAKPRPKPDRPRKLTSKEKRELEALPDRIDALEAEQAELHQAMAQPAFYKQGQREVLKASARLKALTEDVATAYVRWEELEALR